MAGANRYKLAKKVLSNYRGQIICLEDLKGIVKRNLATNEKLVLEYLILMRENKLIEEIIIQDGITKWKILDELCQEQTTKEEQTKNGES